MKPQVCSIIIIFLAISFYCYPEAKIFLDKFLISEGQHDLHQQQQIPIRAHEKPVFEKPREVGKKFKAKASNEGPASIRRAVGGSDLKYFDPFILVDFFSVRASSGFSDHPHRGFETVTYMMQGESSHQDFAGHKGTIKSGDVQWMTAGRGIVHSECASGAGENTGMQIWLNLAAKDKMMEPRYQELEHKDISRVEKDGVTVKIIAGESFGVHSPIFTTTPTMFLDFTLQPGTQVDQHIPETWNACVYVLEGKGVFGNPNASAVASHHVVVLDAGDGVSVWNPSAEKLLRFIMVGGQPLNEPMVHKGIFVMNTKAEIDEAFQDYYSFRNGFERAKHWKSTQQ